MLLQEKGVSEKAFIVPPREVTMERLMRGFGRVAPFSRDMPYTTADRLEERAEDSPDTPFILFEDQSITFAEMNRRANRIGHAALAAGFKRGDVVALLMENRPEYVAVWLGLAKAGIITALINTTATGTVLAHAFRQVGARGLIVGTELAEPVLALAAEDRPGTILFETEKGKPAGPVGPDWRDLDKLMAAADDDNLPKDARAGITARDPLYLIFTSGTTGLPKAAIMSHLRFINSGEMIGGLMQMTPEDVFYCVLPLYHGAGGMVVPSTALAIRCPFLLRRKFSRSGFFPDVRRHRVTTFYYMGEIIRYLLTLPPAPDDRDNTLRAMAGAGLKPDIWRAFVERFGVTDVLEGLGGTEANYGITNVDNRIGSVGRIPYPDQSTVRVLKWDVEHGDHVRGADGRPVLARAGEVGELVAEVLGGNGVAGFFEGYTSKEATEGKLLRNLFRDGDCWFRSGDLVRFDADDYYYFVDRTGDTFRWKSENVSTQEVQNILSQFPGLAMVNLYGVEVPGTEGRAGMAALTLDEGATFDGRAFYEFARENLAHYARPVFVRLTPAVDMTTTFKLKKITLQREGYAPENTGGDPLYVADEKAETYVPLDAAALSRLGIAPFAGRPENQ